MQHLAELQEVRPEGTLTLLGRHRVFGFRNVCPDFTFEAVLLERGDGRLVELTARDSYDERLAVFLLDQAAELELPDARSAAVRVVPASFPPPWSFDRLVVVPPRVARRFEHESALLEQVTYWLVPAYRGEVADGEDGSSFERKISGKGVPRLGVVRWDRSASDEASVYWRGNGEEGRP